MNVNAQEILENFCPAREGFRERDLTRCALQVARIGTREEVSKAYDRVVLGCDPKSRLVQDILFLALVYLKGHGGKLYT